MIKLTISTKDNDVIINKLFDAYKSQIPLTLDIDGNIISFMPVEGIQYEDRIECELKVLARGFPRS